MFLDIAGFRKGPEDLSLSLPLLSVAGAGADPALRLPARVLRPVVELCVLAVAARHRPQCPWAET